MATKKKKEIETIITHTCVHCNTTKSIKTEFYKSKSDIFQKYDGTLPICKQCLGELFARFTKEYRSTKEALKIICYLCDWYFSQEAYNAVEEKSKGKDFNVGVYARILNNSQYSGKTFYTSLRDESLVKTSLELRQEQEAKWTEDDIRKKDTVIAVYGYDPFPPEDFSDKARKYLFTNLLEYFDDEVESDAYKRDAVKFITINNYHISNNYRLIERLDPITDYAKIKDITDIISKYTTNNEKIAKENEISIKNKSNREVGKNTFTGLQKELREKDFEKSLVDYYRQLKSEGTRWILNASLQAISEHTYFDEADKQDILNIQRELIATKDSQIDELKEEKRLLNVEVEELKKQLAQLNDTSPLSQD